MKKNKLKHLLKFGILLFGVSLFIISCQKDDETYELESKTPKSNLNITTVRTNDIENNSNLMRVINKAKKKVSDNKTNKTVYNAEYDFTINTDYAKVIENNGLKNYTFGVYRTLDNGLLENLLLEEQADSTFKVSLVQYNITNSEKNSLINGQVVDLENKITFIAIDDISDTIFCKVNSDAETCIVYSYEWVEGQICGAGGNHTYSQGSECSAWGNPDLMATSGGYVLTASEIDCSGGGSTTDPSSPSGDTSGSTQNGGYSSGTNNEAPDTTPILCPECPEIDEFKDPCIYLKNATDNQNIQTAINNVKPQTQSKIEFAYEIERQYNYDTESYDYTATLKAGSNFNTPVQVGGHIQGQVHNHPKNGIAIPTWGDIQWTYACEDNNTNRNNNSAYNIVVVKDPENTDSTITYAVTIEDFDALGTQVDFEMSQPKVEEKEDLEDKLAIINKKFSKNFKDIGNDTSALEQKFLEVHANYGISLYKMNDDTNKWEKLSLENPYDPDNPNADNSVIKEPCNN